MSVKPSQNQPFRIGRSKTGLGMFATTRIPRNKRIFEYTGRIISNEAAEKLPGKPRYLYDLNKSFTLDGSPRSNLGRYANHSCRPNAVDYTYRGHVYVRALRVIEPGEEITYDYGKEYFQAFIGSENCLCPKCAARRDRAQGVTVKRAAASAKRPEKKTKRSS
jgi:SET domain-containing protein